MAETNEPEVQAVEFRKTGTDSGVQHRSQYLMRRPPKVAERGEGRKNGAGEGTRTLNIQLGKLVLYH